MEDFKVVLPQIRSMKDSLTKTEKKVAEYVLEHVDEVIYSSITDLAEAVSVGEASVLRFCRKIGYRSYHEFKMVLAQELSANRNEAKKAANEEAADENSIETIMSKALDLNLAAMKDTIALLDDRTVEKATCAILKAKRVLICGSGNSGVTAFDAVYKLTRIGIKAEAYWDPHLKAMIGSLLTKDDVVIGISFSGSTKDTLADLTVAKKAGAQVIAITHHARSPITKLADISLLHGSREDPLHPGTLPTKISQLFVLDILYAVMSAYIAQRDGKAKEIINKTMLDKLF